MIINLWSTPRTGSNWYAQYLLKKYSAENVKTKLFAQYLNQFHFVNYMKLDYPDFVYDYDTKCSYKLYMFDHLRQSISHVFKSQKRFRDAKAEETYRLELLSKHDHIKNPSIFYSHIAPMSNLSYKTLFDMAERNIFLYRKDIKRQVASYTLAYGTGQYKPSLLDKVYENITVDPFVIKNLVNRIIKWHELDKTNCEVLCYEDLNFSEDDSLPKQQNKVDPFDQLSIETQDVILKYIDYFNNQVEKIV